jgi:SAM-dependent methyltransferase
MSLAKEVSEVRQQVRIDWHSGANNGRWAGAGQAEGVGMPWRGTGMSWARRDLMDIPHPRCQGCRGMDDFYRATLSRLLAEGCLDLEMQILVLCGDRPDAETFRELGFRHVTISNLDERLTGNEFGAYQWSFQDAEQLGFPDGSFDFCVVHNGLHHCYSPHRALLEMYRVARKGLLAFEPRDSALTRLGVKLGLGQEYEVAAVAGNGLRFGGVRNCAIPNYVYRWGEREVEKTVWCCDPLARAKFRYFYALRVPEARLQALKNPAVRWLARIVVPVMRAVGWLWPSQTNCFAFAVLKPKLPGELQPWLESTPSGAVPKRTWFEQRYNEFR